MKRLNTVFLIGSFCLFLLQGCKKFLDEKAVSSQVIPKTLQDLQGLLDNYAVVNRTGIAASEASADNYFINDVDYSTTSADLKRLYTWEKDNLFANGISDWSRAYDRVFIANIVLDNISGIQKNNSNETEWDDIKAQALFLRAYAFLDVAIAWTLSYDANTSTMDKGIPLRLHSDINEKISRSTLKETYERILNDLNEAAGLAKIKPLHPMRSSKPAVYGLIARTYLSMRDYDNCLKNADQCLMLKNTLLDFNSNPPLNPNAAFPFNNPSLLYNNPEIIYVSRMSSSTLLNNTRCKIDTLLYQSYQNNDLRKLVYFKNNNNKTFAFKGSLEGNSVLFNGIAVDEIYLMRAECYSRKNMINEAMDDLNTLMVKRWNKTVAYPTFTASNAAEALGLILNERRKELLMRGLRWMDIKRLNKEGANINLRRIINGQTYILPPNDNRFALAIPEEIIAISGMPQNLR
jgi:hypothetical protein